jgi:hypothetical protein
MNRTASTQRLLRFASNCRIEYHPVFRVAGINPAPANPAEDITNVEEI